MENRLYERIPANLEAKFLCHNSTYYATIRNCSENGLCINTSYFLNHSDSVNIQIPLKKGILNLTGRTVRIEKIDDYNHIIGIELIESPDAYTEFIDTLRNFYKSLTDFSIRWFIPHLYQ